MKAIAIHRDESRPRVLDKPRPEPGPDEALVRTLRVGVDGTDREVIDGAHGGFPAGEDHLVLGHEAVGVVVDGGETGPSEGSVVVPLVRRPRTAVGEAYAARDELDMAPPEAVVERGIDGAHGFMTEYFVSPTAMLVEVPSRLADAAFLVEPLSITAKALDHARASRSAFDWRPESAIVLGTGSLGLLALASLSAFDRQYCLGRRSRPDPAIDVIDRLGATYVDSRETPVRELADAIEPMDLVYEATGDAKHAFETVDALAPNGVGVLLGLPDPWTFDVDGGQLHRDLVLRNKAVIGSVNAGRRHVEAAVETLDALPEWFIDAVVTDIVVPDAVAQAFDPDEKTIKTAVEFHTHEKR